MKVTYTPFKFENTEKEIPDGYHYATITTHSLTSHYRPSFDIKEEAISYIRQNANKYEIWTILETYEIVR